MRDNDNQLYYIKNGRIYECEIVKQVNILKTIRYLKDGEWIYELAHDSDILKLSPEEVK